MDSCNAVQSSDYYAKAGKTINILLHQIANHRPTLLNPNLHELRYLFRKVKNVLETMPPETTTVCENKEVVQSGLRTENI